MRRREKFPHSRRCPGSPRETLPAMYSPCASPSGTTDRPMRIPPDRVRRDRKSTRLNSSHSSISYAVFCLKKKKKKQIRSVFTGPDTRKRLRVVTCVRRRLAPVKTPVLSPLSQFSLDQSLRISYIDPPQCI